MLPVDRRHRILEWVAEQQTIHIGELARSLGVSEMTIRRDIARLERDGFLRRTYGGATAHVTRSLELAFNARALQHAAAKRLIGMQAAELVADATTIFAGIGTTVEQFAFYLRGREGLAVVTNSLPVASLLGTRPGRVVALGGAVRRDELSCIGPITASSVARYNADVAVLGAAGLSIRAGMTELTDEEAEVHRAMIERSETLLVVADASKLGLVTSATVAPVERIDTLVTDEGAPADQLQTFGDLGIRVVIARREAVPDAGSNTEA